MKKNIRNVTAICMAFFILLTFTAGCGKEENPVVQSGAVSPDVVYTEEEAAATEVLKVGDYTIYLDETLVYLFQQLYSYGLTSETLSQDEEVCREETISKIRETYIIYDVAIHDDIEVTDEDVAASNESAANFIEVFDGILETYGISEEAVEECFYKQYIASKYENDMKNSMSETINNELNEQYKNVKFMVMYMFTFPTIEMDSENMPVIDEDGNYISLSEDEMNKVYEKAEEAKVKVTGGADAEEVAEEYGVSDFSSETTAYDGGTSDELNEMLTKLGDGGVSDIIKTDKGYVFYQMKDSDNEDLKSAYIYAMASEKLDTEYEALRNSWLTSIEVNESGDLIGNTWDEIDVLQISIELETVGIV